MVRQIAPYLRAGDRVLDVGCGAGALGRAIMESPLCAPGVQVSGLERTRRGAELISVEHYKGPLMPYADRSFDVVILADVLHHEEDPHALLRESVRVARRLLVVKDHKKSGVLAQVRIALLDWAANRPYGIPCLYRYNSEHEWRRWHEMHGLTIERELRSMRLYPPIVNLVFGRRLQYLAVLRPPRSDALAT